MYTEFIELFILIAGFIIGLGAVTVIDLHGFLARKSDYWTLATTRTHKVTKPLIWIGTILVLIGGLLNYEKDVLMVHLFLMIILILNGIFLSFKVSPLLLQREHAGSSSDILPKKWQNRIFVSFIFSFVGWWTTVGVFVYSLI
jgi:hypothetical protein